MSICQGFLPIYLSDGFKCRVNGKRVEPVTIAGGMAIPIAEGKNDITLKFILPGLIPGIILSALTIILLLSNALLKIYQSDSSKTSRLCSKKAWSYMIMLAFAIIFVLFYALPVIFFVINIIKAVL